MKPFNLSLALVFISYIALASYINPTFAQNSPQDYVDAHNQARAQVGVSGISWNQTLSNYAQAYANRVQNANTCNRLVHSGGRYGENLAGGFPEMTGRKAVAQWVGEKSDYIYNTNSCAAGKVCRHYTQVVWRKSVRLGCARVKCDNGWAFVICSYDPPGNFINERYNDPPGSYDPPGLRYNEPPPPATPPAPPPKPLYITNPAITGSLTAPTPATARYGTRTRKPGRLMIGVIVSIATLIMIGVMIYYLTKRYSCRKAMLIKWKSDDGNNQLVEEFMRNYGSIAPNLHTFAEIKKMTNSFSDKLGHGGFGSVYRGKLSDGRDVAVKVLNDNRGNGEDFINEVAAISRTSHVNVVALLGFSYNNKKRALIYEFMPNGSLDKFIGQKGTEHLEWDLLYTIVVGIARGLEYLHRGCNTRIVHLDIKPQNILLDTDFCPKISDFGLAKLCKKKQSILSTMGARGTIGYIAPEVFCRNFGGISHKSDVYSYGMMVLEMVGLRSKVAIDSQQESENYFPNWIYEHVELGRELPLEGVTNEEEKETVMKMIVVGLWCIQTNPWDRPSISKVVEMLEGNLVSLQMPPKPFLGSPAALNTDQKSWTTSSIS